MTFSDFFESLSCNISPKTVGTICHDTPYLSLSQPHCSFSPPSESLSQNQSTSSCVLQLTTSDMAGEKVKTGPPLIATNSWPASWTFPINTAPVAFPVACSPAYPSRLDVAIFDF